MLLVLIALLAILHLPPIQKKLTHFVSNYLSEKMKVRVEIDRIKFSILGNVTIEGLAAWDPLSSKIISIEEIEVTSDLGKLISGKLTFDEIHIAGMEGKLIQGEQRQYIR